MNLKKRNSLVNAMEKKFYTSIIEGLRKQRFNIIINPRMLVSERKNPIEVESDDEEEK